MTLHVVALYQAVPGEAEAMEQHLLSMLEPTRREPGCLSYRVIRSNTAPNTFAILETYATVEAFEYHKSSSHFNTHITNGVKPLITFRHVVIGEELDATHAPG